MTWQLFINLVLAFLFTSLSIILLIHLWQRRNQPGITPFIGLILSAVCLAFPHLVSITAETIDSALFWHNLSLPGLKAVPIFWLLFAARFFDKDAWITTHRTIGLAVIPILTTLFAWSNSWHGWYYHQTSMVDTGVYNLLYFQPNFIFWIGLIYSAILIGIGTIIIVVGSLMRFRLYRAQSSWLMIGALLPVSTYFLQVLRLTTFDLTPFVFMITCLIWSIAIFRYSILDTLSITHSHLIALLPVGILVVDGTHRVIEINPAACQILRIRESFILGQSIEALATQPGCLQLVQRILADKAGEVQVTTPEATRWLQIDLPLIQEVKEKRLGNLVVLQDITLRKNAEKMRSMYDQIAEKASTTHNLNDFYRGVHEIINQYIPAKNLFIAIYDPETDLVNFPYFIDEKDSPPAPRKPQNGLTEYILRTGEPLLISPDVTLRLKLQQEARSIGTPAIDWVGVPLKDDRGITFGVLAVQSYSEGTRYTKQDVDSLSFVSRQMGMAIQRLTAIERIRQSEERFRMLVERQGEGMGIVDPQENFVFANPAANLIFGVAPRSLISMNLRQFLDPQEFERVRAETSLREQGKTSSYEITITCPNGQKRNLLVTATPQFNAAGLFVGTLGIFRDITDRKQTEMQLAYLGTHDTLTGLFNRNFFESRLGDLSYPVDYPLSIIILDLDGMKTINDNFGHAAGDDILKALAGILRESFRLEDTISRIGGDEFAVILRNTPRATANSVLKRFKSNLEKYNRAHPELPIQVSVGFAHSAHQILHEDLFRQADELMYEEKRRHKAQIKETLP